MQIENFYSVVWAVHQLIRLVLIRISSTIFIIFLSIEIIATTV
jgi:hypothetical protein